MQILIGVVSLSSDTGKIHLIDKTGSVNICVIASNRTSQSADREQPKVVGFTSLSEIVNCMVALRQYSIVYEQFQVCNIQSAEQFGDPQYVLKHRSVVYVVCHIDNIILLHRGESKNVKLNTCGDCKYEELIYVEKKESLIMEGTKSQVSLLRCNLKGFSLGQCTDDDNICESVCSKCDRTKEMSTLTSIVFILEGPAAQWYPVIEEQAFYRVSSLDRPTEVKLRQYSTLLKKVIERADGKACVRFTEDIHVEKVECNRHVSSVLTMVNNILLPPYRIIRNILFLFLLSVVNFILLYNLTI